MRYGLLLCQLGTYDPLLPERRSLELPGRIGQFPERDFNPRDIQLLLRTVRFDFRTFAEYWATVITSPFIAVTGDLTELNELFNLYWRRIIPLGQTSSIAFPFSRLHNEPFWELLPLPGNEMIPATVNNISSVSQLRTVTLGARLANPLM